MEQRNFHGHGGMVGGIVLAGIGVLLLLQTLGISYFQDLERYWPVILIVVGVTQASRSMSVGGRVWGGTVVVVGGIFLLSNFGVIPGNVWRFFWPGILILIGAGMLARNLDRHNYGGGPVGGPSVGTTVASGREFAENLKNKIVSDIHARVGSGTPPYGAGARPYSADHLNEWAIFSGIRRRIDSQNFQGGEAFAMFGGVELDIRKAASTLEEIIVEVNAIFGGVELRVPETWNVTVRGAGIFGGYEDKTMRVAPDAKAPHLIVHGFAVFGGVSIQN